MKSILHRNLIKIELNHLFSFSCHKYCKNSGKNTQVLERKFFSSRERDLAGEFILLPFLSRNLKNFVEDLPIYLVSSKY